MVFITLFVMAVVLLMAGGSHALLQYLETKPQVTIFFQDEKEKDSVDQLMSKLENTGKVSNIKYISKEEALSIYQEQNKDDPLLLEMVTADILPSSLEVSAVSPKYLEELKIIAEEEPGIDEIVFQKDVIDTLVSWTSTVRRVGLSFLVFLIIATVFILLTSVGMKIAMRKDEIKILRLVGATGWYIKKPFIFEGLIYGSIGAGLAFIMVSLLVLYIQPFITSFLQGVPSLTLIQYQAFRFDIWPFSITLYFFLFTTLLVSGLLIGLLGSIFAVSRYLKY